MRRRGDLAPPRLRALAARAAGHRRLAAALLAGSAVVAAVQALTPGTAGAAGAAGTADGAATQPPAARPAGSLGDLTGADAATFGRTAVAVRLADPAGLVLAAPGRHVDVLAGGALPAAGAPSQEQARLRGGDGGGDPVATDAVVLAVPEPPVPAGPGDGAGDVSADGSGDGSGSRGGLAGALGSSTAAAGAGTFSGVVVLAVRPADVRGLAAGAGSRAFSLALPLPARP